MYSNSSSAKGRTAVTDTESILGHAGTRSLFRWTISVKKVPIFGRQDERIVGQLNRFGNDANRLIVSTPTKLQKASLALTIGRDGNSGATFIKNNQAFQSIIPPLRNSSYSTSVGNICEYKAVCKTCPKFKLSNRCAPISTAKLDLPTLVFVTPDGITRDGDKAIELCGSVLRTPSTLVQVRDTSADEDSISELVSTLLMKGLPATRMVVNGLSYGKVSKLHENLGFHMKENDARNNKVLLDSHASKIVGCAVHSVTAAEQALQNYSLDYLQVGTMFETLTHPGKSPEGPQLLKMIRSLDSFAAERTKLIGVGGINVDNAGSLMMYGAHGVAVIRTISAASNPGIAANNLMVELRRAVQNLNGGSL